MRAKPDLVITAVGGYQWEQIRPYVISLATSGFAGDKVLLAAGVDEFALECATYRDFQIGRFVVPAGTSSWDFIQRQRYVPLLRYLAKHKHEYRYVIWSDASDLIFQGNPSAWLEQHVGVGATIVAARECWRIKDETTFNLPWATAAFPDEIEWLQKQEVLCGGTLAGDAETVFLALSKVYEITSKHPEYADQAVLNYVLHKPFNFPVPTRIYIPAMKEGWTATCSAFQTEGFKSCCPRAAGVVLTDEVPVFDQESTVVWTPDGKTPFVIVHQFNRSEPWVRTIPQKYQWD
jgi:hypothetical protein